MMHDPEEEKDYVEWMKKKQLKIDKHYESKVKEILDPNKDVKYFKRNEKAFADKSVSTVSKRKQVVGRYEYRWNKKRRVGKSFVLKGVKSRYMPYELYPKDKKPKK